MTINHDRAQVDALGALTPSAQDDAPVGPVDLDAIEARARKRIHPCEGDDGRCGAPCTKRCNAGGDCGIERCDTHALPFSGACDHDWYPVDNGADDTIALVKRVRELEAEADEYDALIQRQGALLLATADALKGPPPPLSQHSARDLPEVAARLRAALRSRADEDAYRLTREEFAQRDPNPTVPGQPGERVERRG